MHFTFLVNSLPFFLYEFITTLELNNILDNWKTER